MPTTRPKVKFSNNMHLRDFRIVTMARDGLSFQQISDLLKEQGINVTKQRIAFIVQRWEGLTIRYEDDKVIIH